MTERQLLAISAVIKPNVDIEGDCSRCFGPTTTTGTCMKCDCNQETATTLVAMLDGTIERVWLH